MKKLIYMLFLFAVPMFVHAQENDFGMIYSIGATKKIDKKWSVGAEAELRTRNDARTVDHLTAAVEGSYKFTTWLKLSAQYKFLSDRREEKLKQWDTYRPSYFTPKHRVSVSLTGDVKVDRFKLSLRERWQYTYRPEKITDRYVFADDVWEDDVVSSKAHNTLRSRFQVEYDIAKCKIDPFASVEIYNSMAIERTRLTVGAEYKLAKKHVFEIYYRYQNDNEHADETDKNTHFIGLGYNFKF